MSKEYLICGPGKGYTYDQLKSQPTDFITMVVRTGGSNHWQLNCFFTMLLKQTIKKPHSSISQVLWTGIHLLSVDSHHKGPVYHGNREGISKSWMMSSCIHFTDSPVKHPCPQWFLCFNSLAPEIFKSNFRKLIFKLTPVIDGWGISSEMRLDECHCTLLMISQHWFR